MKLTRHSFLAPGAGALSVVPAGIAFAKDTAPSNVTVPKGAGVGLAAPEEILKGAEVVA